MSNIDTMFTSVTNEKFIKIPKEEISKYVENKNKDVKNLIYEILFDRSASMFNMPIAPEALQTFVNEQKNYCEINNIKSNFTLTVFDTVSEKVPKFDNVDVRDTGVIPKEYLRPRGYTRLIDSAIERIAALNNKLESLSKKTDNSYQGIFVIVTDGHDNQSKKTDKDLSIEIQKLTNKGVQCYFLGANQDAIHTGRCYGFTDGQSLTYEGDSAMHAMRSTSENIVASLSGQENKDKENTQQEFTKLQRELSGGKSENFKVCQPSPIRSSSVNCGYLKYQETGADIKLQIPSLIRKDTTINSKTIFSIDSDCETPVADSEKEDEIVKPSCSPLSVPLSPPSLFRKAVQDNTV